MKMVVNEGSNGWGGGQCESAQGAPWKQEVDKQTQATHEWTAPHRTNPSKDDPSDSASYSSGCWDIWGRCTLLGRTCLGPMSYFREGQANLLSLI